MKSDAAERTDAAEPMTARGPVSWPMRFYMLLILSLCYAMSIADRRIIEILVQPIKKDLKLTDGQIGLLGGLTFALVYAVLSIPAARLGDRWSRSKVVAIAIGFWSLMTMLCGVATSYLHLILARLGVGAGEASGNPSAQALVSDLFPLKGRGTVMALFFCAVPIGHSLGYLIGGYATTHFDWRTAFYFAGLPGLLLVPLLLFTFPKIPKGMADGAQTDAKPEPLLATMKQLWSIAAFRNLLIAATLQAFVASGLQFWVPAFMQRSHGIGLMEVAAGLALAAGAGSLIGHLAGGVIFDLLGRYDLRLQIWMPMATVLVAGACSAAAFVAPVQYVYLLLGLQILFSGLFSAPLYAIVTTLAPFTARATAVATTVFAFNIFGLGLGPWFLGQISTWLEPNLGQDALRTVLLVATSVVIPAAFFYFLASLTYKKDLLAAAERTRTSVEG